MKLELLKKDELLVELEIRELIDSTTRIITPSLKQALKDRLQEEKDDWIINPSLQPHEAASKHPAQETARLQKKLFELQQYVLTQSAAGSTAAEMLPQINTTLVHIRGRVERHGGQSGAVCVVFWLMSEILCTLFRGVTPEQVVEKLSRIVIRVDMPLSGVEDEDEIEEVEEPKEEGVDNHKVKEVEREVETEPVKESGLVDQLASEPIEDTNLPTNEQQPDGMVDSIGQIPDVFDVSEVDHPKLESPDVACFPAKGCAELSVRPFVSTKGVFGTSRRRSKCRGSRQIRGRCKMRSARRKKFEMKKVKKRISTKRTRTKRFCVRMEGCGILNKFLKFSERPHSPQRPMNLLLGVLSLCLKYEVLGRRNRRLSNNLVVKISTFFFGFI